MPLGKVLALDLEEHDLAGDDWAAIASCAVCERARRDDPRLDEHLADADVLLVPLGVHVDGALLARAPRLRAIAVLGTSIGRIDVEAARAREVEVLNVPGASTHAVAELAIAIALDHLRGLSRAKERARAGDLTEPAPGRELRSTTLGVVGLGAIGRRVVEIAARGFGATVIASSRTARPALDVPLLALDALLERAEIVSVHLALTRETRGLFDRARIARFRDGALLVHLAPLELLDLDALATRLRARTLSFVTDHGDELAPEALAALRHAAPESMIPPIGYATEEARRARRAGLVTALRALAARA